jgi:hypothetical protein
VVRLEVTDALPGGLAIYGAKFGRYPLDPTVALVLVGAGRRRLGEWVVGLADDRADKGCR